MLHALGEDAFAARLKREEALGARLNCVRVGSVIDVRRPVGRGFEHTVCPTIGAPLDSPLNGLGQGPIAIGVFMGGLGFVLARFNTKLNAPLASLDDCGIGLTDSTRDSRDLRIECSQIVHREFSFWLGRRRIVDFEHIKDVPKQAADSARVARGHAIEGPHPLPKPVLQQPKVVGA